MIPGGFRLQQAWKTQNGLAEWSRIYTANPIEVDYNCHMIVFVADGTTTKIYYDGTLQETDYREDAMELFGTSYGNETEFISSIRDVSLFDYHFNIGGMIRGYTSRFFKGTIGEVQIYNRPLSAPEIGTLK